MTSIRRSTVVTNMRQSGGARWNTPTPGENERWKCNVQWKLAPLISVPKTTPDDAISAIIIQGHDVFVGTTCGFLYKFQIRRHVHRDQDLSFTQVMKANVSHSKREIKQLALVNGKLNYLLVLSNGTITIHSPKDLQKMKAVPCTDVSQFCCNEGNPFYGLCVSFSNRLVLYDLEEDFSVSKTLVVPEQPLTMKWINKNLCLGFEGEYSIIPYNNEGSPKGISTVSHVPIIQVLPTDEFAVSYKNSAIFSNTSTINTRAVLYFKYVPLKFAFSFPFLVSASKDMVEIMNIMDYSYHLQIRKPCDTITGLISDGKEILISGNNQIFVMIPEPISYCVKDPNMLKDVCKNPNDKSLFVRYLSHLLGEPKNPFRQLLTEFTDRFVAKFKNPEDAELPVVKKYLIISLRKLNQVILSYFKQFKKESYKNILFNTLQTIFYSRIYWLIFAMITVKYRNQDISTLEKTSEYKSVTLGMLGARKRFWLTKESLSDMPPKKVISDDLPSTPPTEEEDKIFPEEDEISVLNSVELILKNYNINPMQDVPSPDESGASGRNRSKSKTKLKDVVSPSLQQIFMSEEIKIDVNTDVRLYELGTFSAPQYIGTGNLKSDEMQNLFIKLPAFSKPFYILPTKGFVFQLTDLSVTWLQKEHHYKIQFGEESIFEEISKQLLNYEKISSNSGLKTDDLIDSFVLRAVSEAMGEPDESSEDIPWRREKKDQEKTGKIEIISDDDSMKSEGDKSDFIQRKSSVQLIEKNQKDGVEASPSYSPSTTSPLPGGAITIQEKPPYEKAIKTLKKISHLKSPRDKLGCILQTFKDLIQSVGDFWEAYDREAIVGADDLVPIFSYVILKARIPKLISEMNYIWEFASDAEMNGKYGYGFATFQIGVEIIARLDETIWTMEQENTKRPTQPIPVPSPTEEDHVIHEKRDLLVQQREKNASTFEDLFFDSPS